MRIKKILYKSFDSLLSQEEDKKLKENLSFSKKLQKAKLKIEKLRIILTTMKTGKFKPDFEANLLNKIRFANYPQVFFYKEIQFAFKKFAFAAIMILTFLMLFNFGERGKINILSKEKVKLGEAISSEYFYSAEILIGDYNVE